MLGSAGCGAVLCRCGSLDPFAPGVFEIVDSPDRPELVGGVVAAVVGLAALVWLRQLVNRGRFWTFALYLVPLGAALVIAHLANHGLDS